jgi:hypothetical protein
MTQQLSLLDFVPAQWPRAELLTATPRARRTDIATSHEAAEAIKASGELGRQQLEVLAALRRWPGLTSLELAARMQRDRWMVARRLPELVPIYARRGDPEAGECRVVNGRRHVLWWAIAR